MRHRGFLLVSVLLITIILLTLGLAFLGKRAIQYRRVLHYEQAAQAKELAESGMNDVLLKLERDIDFPPIAVDQSAFSYTEEVNIGGQRVGTYRVTIDGAYRFRPYSIWILTSEGLVGPNPAKPLARRKFRAEFDLQPYSRLTGDVTEKNPFYYTVIQFQDLGGL